jgi:GPH family glycoside/pentoside/hexuronide:cation symporter
LTANIFGQLGLYAKIYVLYEGNTKSGAVLAGIESVCFYLVFYLSIFYGVKLSQRFSKKTVVLATAGLTFLGGPAKLLLYNPDYPYLILFLVLFSAPGGALGSFMTNSLMADIANYDEWKTGERREGMFTAVSSWLYKVSISLSGILSGAVLVAIGFDVDLGGMQSEFTKRWLVLGLALSSMVPALITFGAMYFYPLDEDTVNRCVEELEQRQQAKNTAQTP